MRIPVHFGLFCSFCLLLGCNPKPEPPFQIRKILVIGNSITNHPPKPEIGWNADWGMAASAPEKDFFSLLASRLEVDFGEVEMIRENVFPFEQRFYDFNFDQYESLRQFDADLLIIRLGENVMTADVQGWNFSKSLQQFSDYLLEKPSSKVILTTTFWGNETVDSQLLHAADEKGWTTVTLSHLGREDQYMAIGEFESQSVSRHPNDSGMQVIADLIHKAIISLVGHSEKSK